MRKISKLLFVVVLAMGMTAAVAQQHVERPKLVIGIVVDQMRWDYLYRYYDRYEEGGFKRMLNEGFSCENTFIDYLPSYTAVGHTTVFTGSIPAIHGITGNDWTDQLTGKRMYCTGDSTVQTVGSSSNAGKNSPRNMLVTTIGDELRMATNFRSKVVGVSIKDRASILPAGHTANGAFWYDGTNSSFVTSTYYMNELPEWVQEFNDRGEPKRLLSKGWNTLYPIDTYLQSTADNVPWEATYKGEKSPVFPHDMAKIYKKDPGSISSTPFGNTLVTDFAKEAIKGYSLGKGEFTDMLTINFASTDYVGHQFGPNSIEIEDTYLRLDKDLADFFDYLDKEVGKGNYLVFLTADHGAAHAVNFMKEYSMPAGLLKVGDIMKDLNKSLEEEFGVDKIVRSGMNYQVNYNYDKIDQNKLDYEAIKKSTMAFLKRQLGIQFVVDIENIGNSPVPEPIKSMIAKGYNHKRSGAVAFVPEANWFSGSDKGTTHGTWNPIDTHIPLVFMGWNIPQGTSNKTYNMSDIAPTISSLLHIQMPNGSVGKVVEELKAK